MKGDFTRDTFHPLKNFSRVLMQQGRVTLDADYNEQTAILLHYLRTLAKDLIGPFGVPAVEGGFALSSMGGKDIAISAGRCYVDGILVENHAAAASALHQPFAPDDPFDFADFLKGNTAADKPFLLYLDVWERHVAWIEDDTIRDVALGGPDTCTRAKVIWQLKAATALGDALPETEDAVAAACHDEALNLTKTEADRRGAAVLAARLLPAPTTQSACITAPDSRYRGLENQLYRVEIHDGSDAAGQAFTFKWSRDNGSVATRIVGLEGNAIEVVHSRGFEANQWVEVSFDSRELNGQPGWMIKLVKVEGNRLFVDPETIPAGAPTHWKGAFSKEHPKVRRWDQSTNEDFPLVGGLIEVSGEILTEPQWIDLEDGIQVLFSAQGNYRSGDYWLIPARVATGEIEWPTLEQNGETVAQALPPHGIEHHYAPLGFVNRNGAGQLLVAQCQCVLAPVSECTGVVAKATEENRVPKRPPKKPPVG